MLEGRPLPTPSSPSDLLIKVTATCPCLGELDWAAAFPDVIPDSKEPVPGQDVLGTVVSAPEDSGFKPGDEVFGRIDGRWAGGCREYAIVKKDEMALKPKGLDWIQAVATPLSALTAWQGLFFQGTLRKEALFGDEEARKFNAGQRVFIAGAGTSVGSWAVQFAALAGAEAVIALCSGARETVMKQLGATEIVDYTKTNTEAWAKEDPRRQVDFVFDCIGGASISHLWSAVKDGGAFVSIAGDPIGAKPDGVAKELKNGGFFIVQSIGTQLAELATLVEAGKAKPQVDSVVPFEKFAEAFDKVEGRRTNGKVVIKVFGDQSVE